MSEELNSCIGCDCYNPKNNTCIIFVCDEAIEIWRKKKTTIIIDNLDDFKVI